MAIPQPSSNDYDQFVVPLNLIRSDFPEMFLDFEVLHQAYDEVVRSIRILPSIFNLTFNRVVAPETPMPAGNLLDTITQDHNNTALPVHIKFKEVWKIESSKKYEKFNEEGYVVETLRLANDLLSEDTEVWVNDNLIKFDRSRVIKVVAYMYPHFFFYKEDGEYQAHYELEGWIENIWSDKDNIYLNRELVLLMIAKVQAINCIKRKDYEGYTYAEHIYKTLCNYYNKQREAVLESHTIMSKPENAI